MAELRKQPLKEIVYNNSNNESETVQAPVPAPAPVPVPSTVSATSKPTLKKVEVVYNNSNDETITTLPAPVQAITQPAIQTTTTTTTTKPIISRRQEVVYNNSDEEETVKPTTKRKGKVEYEVVLDEETGTMKRVPKTPGILGPALKPKTKAKGKYKKEDLRIISHDLATATTPESWTAVQISTGKMITLVKEELPIELLEAIERGEVLEATQEEKIKAFYSKRARNPQRYTYTPEGNLLIKGEGGTPDEVILLRSFSALKPEEIQELETKRKEELADNEESYEDALMMLREGYTEYLKTNKRNPEKVFKLNERLREISLARNNRAFPMRWNFELANPSTNEIDLSQPFEQRKLGYPVYLFKRYPFQLKDALGHYRERTEETQEGGRSMELIFITDEESPFHPSRELKAGFVHDETKFSSPYQAYQYQVFKETGDEETMKKILGTTSALTITNLVVDKKTKSMNPSKLWKDILKSLYFQDKEMRKVLLDSGSMTPFYLQDIKRYKDTFDPKDYSDALSAVRTELRQEDEEGIRPESYKNASITDEEKKKARTGAIINNFRRGFHG